MAQRFGSFQKKTLGFGLGSGGGSSRVGAAQSLNLTPMIDMMTILLVFLIKSYSAEPAFLTPTQEITLAITTSETAAPDKAVLIIGKEGIMIDGKVILIFKNGEINKADLTKEGELPELRRALEEVAKKTKFIAEHNPSVQFTGTLILQADRELAFESMKPILRTAGLAGFHDFKFAGVFAD